MSRRARKYVFPTGVGMNREKLMRDTTPHSVPHGRGDEPEWRAFAESHDWCSPRAWG